MTDYVSAVEAARLSGLSERTIRRWVKRGKLRAVRDGHAVRVPLSEVMNLCGQQSCRPADSGQGGHVDSGHSGPSHDGEQTAGHDNGQDSLLILVRELKTELVRTAAAASMWQARAEMLGHRLRALEAPREAPTDASESHTAPNLTAQDPEPPREPAEPPPEAPIPPEPEGRSWWRRLWGALLSAPG